MSKLFSISSANHSTVHRRPNRSYIAKIALTFVALIVTVFSVWPVSAAVELNYFSVVPSSSAILLEWSTAKEYNIIGFQLMCKQAGEADTAYHPIVSKSSKGSPSEGMTYDHLVTSGLTPGVPYCFRLKEITINDEPGQTFDRCGYGLSITPTPTLAAQFLAETATAQVFANATDAAMALLLPTIDPLVLTLTPQPPLSPVGTPDLVLTQQSIFAQQTAQAVAAATVQQQMFDSTATASALGIPATETAIALTLTPDFVAATETAIALTLTPSVDPASVDPASVENFATPEPPVSPLPPGPNAENGTNILGGEQSPEVSAQQTSEAEFLMATQTAQAIETEQAIQSMQATQPQGDQSIQASQVDQAQIDAQAQIDQAQIAQAQIDQAQQSMTGPESPLLPADGNSNVASGGYPYVVVTAVSTEIPATAVATFTPLPTALPTANPFITSVMSPTPQTMMVGLLFLIFIGASGIGLLGLLSGVFYARSRSRRRDRYPY